MNLNENLQKKIFYSLFIGFIIINILMIFWMRLLPFIDLPQHLAYATIYKYIGESGNVFDQYFEFDSMLLKFNTLHVLLTSLDIWGTVELGNKIFYVLYIILLPVSILLLIKKLDGNYWLAFLSFLFLYNFNVSWGFVVFMMAIPFSFLVLCFQHEYVTTHSLKSSIILCILLIIVYHLHLLIAFFITGLVLIQHIYYNRKSLTNILKRGLVYVPIILLVIYGTIILTSANGGLEKTTGLKFLDYYKHEYWYSLKYRIGGFFFLDNFFLFKGIKGILIGFFFSLFTIVSILWPFKIKIRSLRSSEAKENKVFAFSIFIYSLLVYLLVVNLGYTCFRFAILVTLSLIIGGSLLLPNKKLTLLQKIIPVVCLLYFILWFDYFSGFQKENKKFTPSFFEGMSKDKVLSGLIYEPMYRGKYIYLHFPDYYITWHHGIETSHIAYGYPNYRLMPKVNYEKLPRPLVWISKTKKYNGSYDKMDYLLIKGKYSLQDEKNINKNFIRFRKRDDWILMVHKSAGIN